MTVKDAVIEKLEVMPAVKQRKVLEFMESMESNEKPRTPRSGIGPVEGRSGSEPGAVATGFLLGDGFSQRLFCRNFALLPRGSCYNSFDMGQIVIDIPSETKRRYVVTDEKRADDLLIALEATAKRVKNKPTKLTRQQLEDISDHKAALKSIEEMRRTGVSYTLGELRHELGLP